MRLKYILLAVIIGLLIGRLFRQSPKPQVVETKTISVIKKEPMVAVPKVPKEAPAGPVLPKVTPLPKPAISETGSEPKLPPPGHLHFEIKEGLAVVGGDMVMGQLNEEQRGITSGIVKAKRTLLWPTREIPFSIQGTVQNRGPIEKAIEYFHQNTEVRFVPFTGQKDSLVFVASQEMCASYLGRVGGSQPIFVGPNCGLTEILHELMHALGFVHEHSRADRDQFLTVNWKNINPKFIDQFYIVPDDLIHEYTGSVFDFDSESIMLYDSTAFAFHEGQITLQAKGNLELKPTRDGLSRRDRERLVYLY